MIDEGCSSWTWARSWRGAGYERLLAGAERDLRSFVVADGTVAFALLAHIITAAKPAGAS